MINYKVKKCEIMEIGVNEARFLLNLNTKNRSKKNSRVAQYLFDINNDKFEFNGSSIVISKDGVLLDGQHRLMALEQSDNKKIEVVLVTGIEEKTMSTIDIGAKRTAGDVLKINNISNNAALAATIKLCLEEFYMNRKKETGERSKEGKTVITNIVIPYTNEEIMEEYINNKDKYDECLAFGEKLYKRGVRMNGLTVSTYSAFLYLLSKENKEVAKKFLEELNDGVKRATSDVALILRNYLINETIKSRRISTQNLRNLVIYCFRKYKNNDSKCRLDPTKQQSFFK